MENYQSWKHSHEEVLVNSALKSFSQFEITNAEIAELNNGKHVIFMTQSITLMIHFLL